MSPGCLIGLRMDFVLEGKWAWKKKGCCKTLEEKSSTSTDNIQKIWICIIVLNLKKK
jgi:hypothetical protein